MIVQFLAVAVGNEVVFVKGLKKEAVVKLPGVVNAVRDQVYMKMCSGVFTSGRGTQIMAACDDGCIYIVDGFKV